MTVSFPAMLACLVVIGSLSGCGQFAGGPDGRTLSQRRQAINDGTAEGVVLIPARSREAASAPTPQPAAPGGPAPVAPRPPAKATGQAPAAAPAAPAAPGAAATAAAAAKPLGGILPNLPPPGGRPMNSSKTLQASDLGLPVPTAGSASQPAAGSR